MAIQNRRGIYSDFDPTKMVEGEFAVVQSGDPNTSDGKAVYIAPTTGTAERVALYKDLQQEVQAAITDATDEVIQEVTAGIIEGVAEDVTKAETAATNAETSAQNAEASAQEAQEILENKADKDGYYPDLYAGNLSSTKKQTDSTPYLMRKTGGDLSRIGERESDTLVGATVNVNQLFNPSTVEYGAFPFTKNGIEFTLSAEGRIILNGTATANISALGFAKILSGHKYYRKNLKSNPFNIFSYYPLDDESIVNATGDNEYAVLTIPNGTTVTNYEYCGMLVDLTAKFGSSIADYLYSLETATAGAGIAKLRSWGFLRGYQAYNAGSIESVEVTGKKVVGFNQFDLAEFARQYPTACQMNGDELTTTTDLILYHNGVSVKIPSETVGAFITYEVKTVSATLVRVRIVYEDGTIDDCIEQTSSTYVTVAKELKKKRIVAVRFNWNSSGTFMIRNLCINLSNPDRNGEYEPYKSITYSLGNDTLRGMFKLDANNQLYADGDRKESDGTVTRKYGIVDLGTLSWTYITSSTAPQFRAALSNTITSTSATTVYNAICAKYPILAHYTMNDGNHDKSASIFYASLPGINITDSSYSDAATFKTAMSGVYLVYELATPTTEQSTPFTSPQICDPDGTEEFIAENNVPVGHETEYPYDLKGLVEGLIDVPDVPSANGTYVLKATRSADGITYTWVSE